MAIVNYHQGEFYGTYTPGVGTPTMLRLKWGVAPGSYPNTVTLPYALNFTKALRDVFTQDGLYYAVMTAATDTEETAPSAEVTADVRTGLGLVSLIFRAAA